MARAVEIVEIAGNYVRARVESGSAPGTFHDVELTPYGAICDCVGTLNLKHKKHCIHADAVVEFIRRRYGLDFAMAEEMKIDAYYVKTNSFIDVFGGLLAGEPTLFYGPDGSGKTVSALTIMARYSEICDGKIVYVNTETGDPQNRYAKNQIAKFGGDLGKMEFFAFVEESKLHAFLGGRGDEKSESLKDVLKKGEISMVVIDSISRFYNTQVNNVPPQQRPMIASNFVGKLGVWVRFLQECMFKTKPFPILFTAWMRSQVGQVLKKEDVDRDIEEMSNPQQLKEWTGPKVIGSYAKVIFKVMPAGIKKIEFTQIRGEFMMKKAYCRITERGVELE
jgi:hypothetical protein